MLSSYLPPCPSGPHLDPGPNPTVVYWGGCARIHLRGGVTKLHRGTSQVVQYLPQVAKAGRYARRRQHFHWCVCVCPLLIRRGGERGGGGGKGFVLVCLGS